MAILKESRNQILVRCANCSQDTWYDCSVFKLLRNIIFTCLLGHMTWEMHLNNYKKIQILNADDMLFKNTKFTKSRDINSITGKEKQGFCDIQSTFC